MASIPAVSKVLRASVQVVSRAVLWKIPHKTKRDDIRLKIGRYKRTDDDPFGEEEPEIAAPKSSLTLDNNECLELIKFLQENYEPFKQGTKAFIPLDRPYTTDNADQIRAFFSLADKTKLGEFIVANDVIPDDMSAWLQHAHRARAIKEFEAMLSQNGKENAWQSWFEKNCWILGSEFVSLVDDRRIDVGHISDFLMKAYDGFLDIVEIKRPEGGMTFWAAALDHGNYVPSVDLTKAVAQASRYIFEVEKAANNLDFMERMGGVKTVKPRCILIFGRSKDWNSKQIEAFRIFNAGFHNLTVMTYDHVLERAKRMIGSKLPVPESDSEENFDDADFAGDGSRY